MSKGAKASASAEVRFEDALERLETIVESMESGSLSLEDLLTRFEEGTRLVKQCQQRLAEAELKVSRLEEALGGDLAEVPADLDPAGDTDA